MKIIYIINGLGPGGAERIVCDLSNELSKENHEIILISFFEQKILFDLNPSVNVRLFNYKFGLVGFIKSLFRTFYIILKLKPQIIHSHLLIANIVSRIIALFLKKIVIVNSAHSISENHKLAYFFYNKTNFLVDLFTNVSDYAVNSFINHRAAKKNEIIKIYNGVNCNKFYRDQGFYKKRKKKLNILSVGSLDNHYKDYTTLIKAFKLIVDKIPYAKLKIVGDGPDLNELIKLTQSLKIDESIFLGNRNDVDFLLKDTDIYISSSVIESFGISIAEAMSSSVLVVATMSEGAKEVVGNCGKLVPISDHKAIFREVMILHNYSSLEKEKIALSSRNRILDNFSSESIIKLWHKQYSFLIKNK